VIHAVISWVIHAVSAWVIHAGSSRVIHALRGWVGGGGCVLEGHMGELTLLEGLGGTPAANRQALCSQSCRCCIVLYRAGVTCRATTAYSCRCGICHRRVRSACT
jgi:hypothetical protein